MTLAIAVILAGIAFPVAVTLAVLGSLGVLTSDQLKSKRHYFVVVAFAIAAIVSPPNVLSQLAVTVLVLLFYEGSILAVRIAEKM